MAANHLRILETSIEDGSYRGEAGILRAGPEVAETLGLRVYAGPEYTKAIALFDEAEKELKAARRAVAAPESKNDQDGQARAIAEAMLSYRAKKEKAEDLLRAYLEGLTPENDQRLDRPRCQEIMTRLLEKSLTRNHNRLRDALGCFANRCAGQRSSTCLTPGNVRFVNAVFQDFVDQAPGEILARFDLDRLDDGRSSPPHRGWKDAAGGTASRIVSLIDRSLQRLDRDGDIAVDPLLFLALIRRESRFDPKAISHVGAAGLTQIMPRTAAEMGMEDVYRPAYFERAFAVLHKEREARREALDALFAITPENGLHMAALARKHMQTSNRLREERKKLFARYRRELRGRTSDPRLQADKAVEFGLRYFNDLIRAQNGDISLALASYNAGPHRVRQYKGIPPYGETVRFRNTVLEFYREYLERLRGS